MGGLDEGAGVSDAEVEKKDIHLNVFFFIFLFYNILCRRVNVTPMFYLCSTVQHRAVAMSRPPERPLPTH